MRTEYCEYSLTAGLQVFSQDLFESKESAEVEGSELVS